MNRKILAGIFATLSVGVIALALSQSAAGDSGCLTNDYIGNGRGATVEAVLNGLPNAISSDRAAEIAREHAALLPTDEQAIASTLVRLNDSVHGRINAFLVATPVDRSAPLFGLVTGEGTAACEVSVIDAETGQFLYSVVNVVPDENMQRITHLE